jgi:hypothetical protein
MKASVHGDGSFQYAASGQRGVLLLLAMEKKETSKHKGAIAPVEVVLTGALEVR